MPNAWVLQSNPEKYDIDAALQALDEIRWRVPQHTAGIGVGDPVVIWRSGPEAGIVGIGVVAGAPRAEPAPPLEATFYLTETESNVATRVPVKVQPCGFVPRAEVASLPEMQGHHILTAPRVTVYPLGQGQWEALRKRLPEPPPTTDPQPEPPSSRYPYPYAWRDRRRAVHPLPGGYDSYLTTLGAILSWVTERQPDRDDLEAWLREEFTVSESYGRFIVDFLEKVGFVRGTTGRYEPTPELRLWLEDREPEYLIAILHARVQFIGELLAALEMPMTSEQARQLANEQFGMGWSTRAQIDRRRGWLQSAGLLLLDEEGRLALTPAGQVLLQQLDVQAPHAPEVVTVDDETGPAPAVVEIPTIEAEVHDLTSRLHASAHNTSDPAAFEKVTRDAFAFLGFQATWLGGAGKTDVLLVADLGPLERYRVVVDCKTTSHKAVPDHQIDWITLREHKERFEADYVALIAPAFHGDRLVNRAEGEKVALIDLDDMVGLCEQHARIPMGLDVYRRLFADDVGDSGAISIAEAAQEVERWLSLSAYVMRLIRNLEMSEPSLGARDLYWNLSAFSDQHGRVTEEEIEVVLQALVSPAVGMLRRTEGGYRSLGSLPTMAQRLQALARMTERSPTPISDEVAD